MIDATLHLAPSMREEDKSVQVERNTSNTLLTEKLRKKHKTGKRLTPSCPWPCMEVELSLSPKPFSFSRGEKTQ